MTERSDATPTVEPVVVHAIMRTESPPNIPTRGAMHDAVVLVIEAIKSLAWPLLALSFFLTFQDAIRRTITLVPDKLEKADKANIGSLSWEIQVRAREQGGTDLARRVGTLSPAAIEELISAPRQGIKGLVGGYSGVNNERGYYLPSNRGLEGLRELESAQLVKFDERLDGWLQFVRSLPKPSTSPDGSTVILSDPLTVEQRNRVDKQNYQLTPKGRQALDAIVKAIGEQLTSR